MNESFDIYVPIYESRIHFELGRICKLEKYLKDLKIDNDEPFDQIGVTLNLYEYGSDHILIGIDEFYEYELIDILPIVSHELIHASNMILIRNNISSNEECDEVLAYVHSFLLKNFMSKINIFEMLKKDDRHGI